MRDRIATVGAMARGLRGRRWIAGAAIATIGVVFWPWNSVESPPDFGAIQDIGEKKEAFFNYLRPYIAEVNAEILSDRQRLLKIRDQLAGSDSAGYFDDRWVLALAEDYGLEPPEKPDVELADRLLGRVDVIAPSLVLAQAATESAWGTSRFARHGNNLFGMRAYDGSGLVPRKRKEGRIFTVAAYDSFRESIEAYEDNLNTHYRYRRLRQIREDLRRQKLPVAGLALANGLGAYSTRGSEYIAIIQSIIRTNDLERYDK